MSDKQYEQIHKEQAEKVRKAQEEADKKKISLHKQIAGHKGNPKKGRKR